MSFDLNNYLAAHRERINQSLCEFLPLRQKPDYLRLREAMSQAVCDGGKRLRPCVTLAACEAVGGAMGDALGPACAVEMIHGYSLVHDDLPAMDDDDFRRGKPTCHKAFGEAAAILVGDATLTRAFELLAAEGIRRPGNAQALIRAAFELARGAGVAGMVGGQAMDIALKDAQPTFEQIEQCHADKTAALFAAAATIGALVGRGTEQQVEALRGYGLDLGMAFQHADDLKDADFPQYRGQTVQRAENYANSAANTAKQFGEAGTALAALADFVLKRAQEAARDEVPASDQ